MMTRFRQLFLILLVALAASVSSLSQGKVDSVSDDLYNQALILAVDGNDQAAIEVLEKLVRKQPSIADAFHQLGLLYMKKGTVLGRMKAKKALQAALRLESGRVQYHLDMAKLLLQMERRVSARSRFEKVIELDRQNAEAFFQLGLLALEEMLWYKTLIAAHNHAVFRFNRYAFEDRGEAERLFQKAIDLDPTMTQAYFQLALIQCEYADFAAMAAYLQKALEVEPNHKDFNLFLGLAYHRMRLDESALECFNWAQKQMTDEERRLFGSVRTLLNSESSARVTALDETEMIEFESGYWRQRDPIFITEVNERILEHFSRVAYANLRFGDPAKGIAGWTTDQGKVYIRFGPPDHQHRTRPEMKSTLAGSGKGASYPVAPSQEVWSYGDFDLVFEDEFLGRNYSFKRSVDAEQDGKFAYEKLIESLPESYEPDFLGQPIEMPHVVAQYKGENDRTKVRVHYGVPASHVQQDQQGRSRARFLKKGIFVFDENWFEMFRGVEDHYLSLPIDPEQSVSASITGQAGIDVDGGPHHFVFELLDLQTGNLMRIREELNVRSFRDQELDMSDLLLGVEHKARVHTGSREDATIDFIPNLSGQFAAGQSIVVYFELYNLELDDNLKSHYVVETTLSRLEPEQGLTAKIAGGLGSLLGSARPSSHEVSTSHEYFGNSGDDELHVSVQIADAKPGRHKLAIRAKDLKRPMWTGQEIEFEIVSEN